VVISAGGAVLAALLAIAAALLALLLLLNRLHRAAEERADRVRGAVERMLERWRERPASPEDLTWLRGLSRGDGRTALLALLAALPDLSADTSDRVRRALRESGLARQASANLSHRSAHRRAEACRMVGRMGGTDAVPRLLERLGDADPAVRREAIRALGELRAVETIEAIAAAIEEMDEWSNLLLVMALVRMGPASSPRIGSLLGASRSPAMTKALLQVTGRIGVASDVALVRSLAAHADPEVRVEAVRVLGAVAPDPESFAVCLDAMDDAEWPVRALAAWAIGRVGDARALARLERAMGDPAYWVRHHVAEAMAALGTPGELALRRALTHDNPFVRDMATQTIFMRALLDGEAA
jgi:HEAT repeat protein